MFQYINRLHDILKDQDPFPLIRMPLSVHRAQGHGALQGFDPAPGLEQPEPVFDAPV